MPEGKRVIGVNPQKSSHKMFLAYVSQAEILHQQHLNCSNPRIWQRQTTVKLKRMMTQKGRQQVTSIVVSAKH